MTRKKNGFLTFIFSLLPGAGEMYMGFMKQGVTLMTIFFGLIAIIGFFNFDALLFLLPIVWFYGFFHVHNLAGMSDEEFYAVEDDYMFHIAEIIPKGISKKQNKIFAWILIGTGTLVIWNSLMSWCNNAFSNFMYETEAGMMIRGFLNRFPQLIIAVVLIVIGIRLIKGKKNELEQEEAYYVAENVDSDKAASFNDKASDDTADVFDADFHDVNNGEEN